MNQTNPLLRAHLLLLRWGEERMTQEAAESERQGVNLPPAASGDGETLSVFDADLPTLPNSRQLEEN